jgi:hypothetical protein
VTVAGIWEEHPCSLLPIHVYFVTFVFVFQPLTQAPLTSAVSHDLSAESLLCCWRPIVLAFS